MRKVVCNNCKAVNKISNNSTYYYCNACGTKEIVPEIKGNNKLKVILLTSIILLIGIFYIIIPVRQYSKVLKTSDIKKICQTLDDCNLNKVIKKQLFSITKYKISNKTIYTSLDETYEVTVNQFGKNKQFSFTIKDDLAPEIITDKIVLAYQEEINYDNQLQIIDYIDGEINIKSENVKVDLSTVDINKEGTYTIKVEAKDELGNVTSKNIKTIVEKQKPTDIILNIKDEYLVNTEIILTASVEPTNTFDKSVTWTYKKDNEEKSIEGDKITFNEVGRYTICAKSVMSSKINKCQNITITKKCESRYVFTLDGGTQQAYPISKTGAICPGIYTIYATAINKSTLAAVKVKYSSELGDFDLINPNFGGYNGNGNKYVLKEGGSVSAESGITKIILTKVN